MLKKILTDKSKFIIQAVTLPTNIKASRKVKRQKQKDPV